MDKNPGSRKNDGARRPWLSRLARLGWVLRYALAVVAVAAAMGLRVAMTAWLGSGLPSYITFYPAVMAVALLAGFGPGLWATVLAALATAYWVLPPSGQFAIVSPVERVGLVIFIGMGLFMSVVAELYRRRRDKAAAYDQEQELREWNATLESKVARRTAELQRRALQLQKLTLELTQAEERERRRIALILHEDLQQQIAGAKFHLSLVKGRTRDERLRAEVEGVEAMLKDVIEQARSLSRDLSPAVLNLNDLAEVLQWLVNRVRVQQGLNVNLHTVGDMTLHSEGLATFLFRAAQEMLLNVVKHAYVREAVLRVRRRGRYVCLCVSDQGRGFDPQELKETAGVGLFSIRERTELLGGRMRVKSAKGKGSRLSIMVPDGRKPEDRGQKTEDRRQTAEDGVAVLCPPSSAFGSPCASCSWTTTISCARVWRRCFRKHSISKWSVRHQTAVRRSIWLSTSTRTWWLWMCLCP